MVAGFFVLPFGITVRHNEDIMFGKIKKLDPIAYIVRLIRKVGEIPIAVRKVLDKSLGKKNTDALAKCLMFKLLGAGGFLIEVIRHFR